MSNDKSYKGDCFHSSPTPSTPDILSARRSQAMSKPPRPDLRRRLTDEPNPSTWPNLAELRIRQWRQNSHDPFEPEESSMPSLDYSKTPVTWPEPEPKSDPTPDPKLKHPKLKHPGSKWIHLFYDLAWAASFASLTGNGKFDNPLDTVNYFLFFTAVLWLWASQTLYSIHFYTNDWFHLLLTFLQLVIYGMLAATTQGYDVTTYIGHSPGEPTLLPPSNDLPTPERYAAEKKAHLSILALAIAFTATRAIHLIQYFRVILYAIWLESEPMDHAATIWKRICSGLKAITRIPSRLKAITIGLVISNLMFIAALVIAAKDFGESVLGASLKLGLWIGGFFVEFFSHSRMLSYGSLLPVNVGVPLHERLQTITTIILGEGINGIATTLAKVLVAPGAGKTVGVNIISAACTVWFIAYIYFEGPKGEASPAFTSARYFPWLLLHFPFLASIVLMLIGMKHQFLVTTTATFNDDINALFAITDNITEWKDNEKMTRFLVKRGIVWNNELQNLIYTMDNKTADGQTIESDLALEVWTQRVSLTVVVNLFKDFSADDDILDNLQQTITEYYTNLTQVIDDVNNIFHIPEPDLGKAEYYKILSELLKGPVLNTRYIIGFAGLLLISLSLIDFVHSWPRDRYECGVLISRLSMGLVLCLLLLLNLGKYQELFGLVKEGNHRAGVFRWLEAFWVLPTIAIAYGVQFLIEIVLARFAKRATQKAQEEELRKREAARPKWGRSISYVV